MNPYKYAPRNLVVFRGGPRIYTVVWRGHLLGPNGHEPVYRLDAGWDYYWEQDLMSLGRSWEA
jgi:hypothetical protein